MWRIIKDKFGKQNKTKQGTNAYCKHMNVKIKLTFACARV